MELEQKRGISITSAALQFPYRDRVVNLLDTPGHRDFSEDTYRVLAACDAAVMVLDAAKGIEPQTLKLFEVCRERRMPLLTFVNKWDRPGRDPLELLDEIEQVLGLPATPVTWPVGIAGDFRGVVDRRSGDYTRFTRVARGATEAPEEVADPRRGGRGLGRRRPEQLELLERGGGRPRPQVVPGRRVHPGLLRLGPHQLRRAQAARRRGRPRARRPRPAEDVPTAPPARSTPRSAASCSRCRPTWTPPTATGSPSSGCARAASSGAWS